MIAPRQYPPGVVGPVPIWALSAEHNLVEQARRRHARVAADIVTGLVTKHPVPYLDDPVTSSARSLAALAESKGMRVQIRAGLDWCVVEGRVGEQWLGFAARWERGRAKTATWYEPEARWTMTDDERPAPDATVTRTVKGKPHQVAHPNRMPRGLDRRHLKLLGGPTGVTLGFAELTARVKALG